MRKTKGNISVCTCRFSVLKAGEWLVIVAIFFNINSFGQKETEDSFIEAFNQIEGQPSVICYSNQLEINNTGGHLQGVQLIARGDTEYVVVTGSSDSYSYYAVIRLNGKNEVIAVNKLMDKPFKHAGGFQIFQNLMAVGIEDNSAKDKSKVCIYDLSCPESPSSIPIATIERHGDSLRATAGCVGMTRQQDQLLLVVGDWDTRHLDFYACKSKDIATDNFELIGTVDTENLSKEDWINHTWLSYQNINLFSSQTDQLFMIGLGQNEYAEDVADLFRLSSDDSGNFNLTKIASKSFDCENGASFKAGAGAEMNSSGSLKIISCGYTLGDNAWLNYFTAELN